MVLDTAALPHQAPRGGAWPHGPRVSRVPLAAAERAGGGHGVPRFALPLPPPSPGRMAVWELLPHRAEWTSPAPQPGHPPDDVRHRGQAEVEAGVRQGRLQLRHVQHPRPVLVHLVEPLQHRNTPPGTCC